MGNNRAVSDATGPEPSDRLPSPVSGHPPEPGAGQHRQSRPSRFGSLLGLASTALKRAPVVSSLGFTERELARVEGVMWREVRSRMEAATDPDPSDSPLTGSAPDGAAPRALLARLLTISIEQSAQEARARLFLQLLQQLHPDEARILAALSDGSQYPVVSVATRGSLGTVGPVVLENASTVGRAAGVALPDWVPAYVTHLQQLQLVSVGPESYLLSDGYEILLTESVVRQAQLDAGSHNRIVRRSLRMSPLGRELWSSCSEPQRPLHSPRGRES